MRKDNGAKMIQWIGVVITVLGLVYNGFRDVQMGNIKLPIMQENEVLTKTNYPIQYCLMAYDPNSDKVYYQHENGIWYDYAPPQRRYEATPQRGQNQNQTTVGSAYGSQGTQGYGVRQSPQAVAYTGGY